MSDSTKAVFLSYASQDAEAAKRICDALRAAGLEVWFDQSELRGGDSWDAKIRRQIKECALFVPVISANTNARPEGYFRLEWKLAVDRSHLLADDHPFLFPVVIDESPDALARVPDKFRDVQWTRLNVKDTPETLALRVGKLLGGEGRSEPSGGAVGRRSAGKSHWMRNLGMIMGLLIGLVYALRPLWSPSRRAEAKPPVVATPAPAAPRSSAWPHDPELKRAIDLIDSLEATLEDYRLADEISARAIERAPADPEAVTVRARVHSAFLTRNFDFSEERGAQAKRFGERAVQLAPDEPNAYYALSLYLDERAGEETRAEALARQACALAPDEPRFLRQVMRVVLLERPEEGLAMGEDLIKRFPRDVLAHYELSIAYRNRRDWEKFEREIDATLALAPLPNAINWKARAGLLHNDLAAVRQWVERVPARSRSEERTVVTAMVYAGLSGDYDFGLKALQGFAEPWFYDAFNYSGPAALPRAMLLAQQGKAGLAREQYDLALTQVAQHRKALPTDQTYRNAEIWILLGLGRLEEARALQRTLIESLRRPFQVTALAGWWFDSIPRSLLLGDRATASQLIREAAASAEGRQTILRRMQMDSRLTAFRDDPEIKALLAEPGAMAEDRGQKTEVSVPIDQKSVAVLAFANLSDDKANEYFSDGISEELLNVLAKVPGLKVTARTSSFHFKGMNTAIPEIAQQLGVAYVVEGSVRKAGDKVRITAQLIKAADGFHVWSDTFTRDLKDIFAVQDEIAGLIAQTLELKIGMDKPLRREVNPEAFQLLLSGRAKVRLSGNANRDSGIADFRAAVALAPDYAEAWAEMAHAYIQNARFGGVALETGFREARAAAQKALALAPDNAAVLAQVAWVRRTADWEWRDADLMFHRAVQLSPDNSDILTEASVTLLNVGHVDEAIALGRRAVALDPLNPEAYFNLSFILGNAGHLAEEVEPARRAVALAPEAEDYHSNLAGALADTGHLEEAERELALETHGDVRISTGALILIRQGRKEEARAKIRQLEGLPNRNNDMAEMYAENGDADLAFAALEKSYALHETGMAWVKVDYYLRSLRSDPRWPGLLRKMGFLDDQLK